MKTFFQTAPHEPEARLAADRGLMHYECTCTLVCSHGMILSFLYIHSSLCPMYFLLAQKHTHTFRGEVFRTGRWTCTTASHNKAQTHTFLFFIFT